MSDRKKDLIGTGAFTGQTTFGNPYSGDVLTAIEYDAESITQPRIVAENGRMTLVDCYKADALNLVKHLPSKALGNVLEIGSGTGIATLEVLKARPVSFLQAVDKSFGMQSIAKFKFNQTKEQEILEVVLQDERYRDNYELRDYWSNFRARVRKNPAG